MTAGSKKINKEFTFHELIWNILPDLQMTTGLPVKQYQSTRHSHLKPHKPKLHVKLHHNRTPIGRLPAKMAAIEDLIYGPDIVTDKGSCLVAARADMGGVGDF